MREKLGSFIFHVGLLLAAPGIWLAQLGEWIQGESEAEAQVRRYLEAVRGKHGD